MSGVAAEIAEEFIKVNDSNNMQIVGLSYEGINNLKFDVWYNRLKNASLNKMIYVEASYKNEINDYSYNIASSGFGGGPFLLLQNF